MYIGIILLAYPINAMVLTWTEIKKGRNLDIFHIQKKERERGKGSRGCKAGLLSWSMGWKMVGWQACARMLPCKQRRKPVLHAPSCIDGVKRWNEC